MSLASTNEHMVKKYANDFYISEILAATLINRGFNYDLAKEILLEPHKLILDPRLLTNADKAAELIKKHIENNSFIFIFADYDVDGLTSGYVMNKVIKECNNNSKVQTYYPNRSDGYGLNLKWCECLVENMKKNNINEKDVLIITVDNGISKVEEVDYLNKNKIDILITDHHKLQDKAPECLIVNPHNSSEEQNELTLDLSGCGVAFKICQLLQAKYELYNMLDYTPYVALSTIADMMPMSLENIALINFGLAIINSDKCPDNIYMFKDYLGKNNVSANDMAFDISPKLNSCGRINDINIAKRFLFEEDYKSKRNKFLKVIEADKIRKKYQENALKSIDVDDIKNSGNKIAILEIEDSPVGILGLIANKISRETGLPSIALKDVGKELTGSARSNEVVDLLSSIDAISEKTNNIVNYGGHSKSLGISIEKGSIEEITNLLNDNIVEEELIKEEIEIDYVIKISDINNYNLRMIDKIPFNNTDLHAPIVALEGVTVKKNKLSNNNKENICFYIEDETGETSLWAWGMGSHYKNVLGSPNKLTIVGTLEKDFMSYNSTTLRVLDFY